VSDEYSLEVTEGVLTKVPVLSSCVEPGGKAYPLTDLHLFPGGPHSKRSWIVFTPERLSTFSLPSQPENINVMFQVALINRGEASIVTDWTLCLVEEGKPQRFRSVPYSADLPTVLISNRTSIDEYAFSKPVEHGRAVREWVLFSVPCKLEMRQYWLGSLQYRDYLDNKTTVTWGSPVKRINTLPDRPMA